VGKLVHLSLLSSGEISDTDLAQARALKDEIDSLQEYMHDSHIHRLSDGRCSVLAGVAYSDIIVSFDKVAEYAYAITKQVRRLSNE